jgi:chitodextrinase
MNLNVQLYIDTSGSPLLTPIYERIELFDFESIELTSSLQDVRDISKVFTDFSQEFTVPASKTNNAIFQHYYNTNIEEGFDARIKQRGYIALNGITFRNGFIRLSESSFVNERPSAYKLTFFGSMVELKDIIGDDELSSLQQLNNYSHDYSTAVVYNGFTTGLGLVGSAMVTSTDRDVIYPAISASNKWYYDSSAESIPVDYNQGKSVNIYTTGTYGIDYTQLKPAIKARHIITAIEDKYSSIDFSNDFFGNSEFDQLYLLLHNNKGVLRGVGDSKTYRVGTYNNDSEFQYSSGDGELRPMETYTRVRYEEATFYTLTFTVTPITPVSGINYKVELFSNGLPLETWSNNEATNSFVYELRSDNNVVWDNLSYRVSRQDSTTSTLSTFNIDLEIEKTVEQNATTTVSTSDYIVSPTTQTMASEVIISQALPKIKIVDFLRGLYSMFNLTSYVDEDGVIVVKPLDDYLRDGVEIDITNKIHTDSYSIKRMKLFSKIDFKYTEPKTFGVISQNEETNDDFGNLEYELTNDSLIFDGDKYSIKLPFEKLFFERLSDENNPDDLIDFGGGWLVDKDENEVVTAPVLFFNRVQDVNTSNYSIGFIGQANISKFNRPSNSSIGGVTTLNFNEEIDEYSGNSLTTSLFNNYYTNYISNVFDKTTRIFSLKAKFDLGTLLTYNMNDVFVIKDIPYIINNIRTNLTSGMTELELISNFANTEAVVVDAIAPVEPSPLNLSLDNATDTSIQFSWNAYTDNFEVTGYQVWVDSVAQTPLLGNVTTHTVTGLTASTSYNIQLKAFDAAGNYSTLSGGVSMSTTASSDVTAPSVPTALTLATATEDSLYFTWTASTDNVAVTGYKVYKGGVLDYTTGATTTEHTITGLTASTSYDIQVSAIDAAANESAKTSIVAMSTTASTSDVTPPTQPTSLISTAVEVNRIGLLWTASTDDTAVTGYEIYVGGVSDGTTANTTYTILGLATGTEYTITVKAYDAAGNYSTAALLIETTL